MIKYLALLVVIGSIGVAQAQQMPDIQDILSPGDTHVQADEPRHIIAEQIDVVLNQLLSLPFEQRQYIFPSLFTMPDLPKKIRTHPEIAVWEGKLPTRIAPEAQQFADHYLHTLNPQLFPYLSPESYRSDNRDRPDPTQSNDWGTAVRQARLVVSPAATQAYPKVKEIIHQPADLIQNPDQHLLSTEDIHRLADGLAAFNAFLTEEVDQDIAFQKRYPSTFSFNAETEQNKVNPFQTKLNKLRQMKYEAALDTRMQESGWPDAKTFAIAADAMARAYRASRMPLPIAFSIRRQRGKRSVGQVDRMVTTLAKMYEALPADVYLVLAHRDEVRAAFVQAGYQSVLNTETVDVGRK